MGTSFGQRFLWTLQVLHVPFAVIIYFFLRRVHRDLSVTYFSTKQSRFVHLFATQKKRRDSSLRGLEGSEKEFGFLGKMCWGGDLGASIQVRPTVFWFAISRFISEGTILLSRLQNPVMRTAWYMRWCKKNCISLHQGFSASAPLTSWAESLLWRHPACCRMVRGIFHFYLLDASSTLLVVTAKNVSRRCQMSPGRQSHPGLRYLQHLKVSIGRLAKWPCCYC